MLKAFKIIPLLTSFFLFAVSAMAQNAMTDEQVYQLLLKEQKAGSSRQQVTTKLMQNGVQIDQLRRVRTRFEREQRSAANGRNNGSTTGNRTRRPNGDARTSDVSPRRSGFDSGDADADRTYQRRSLGRMDNELQFLFPDTTSVYLDETEKEPEGKRIFGHDIFNNKKLTFEGGMNIATPQNYVLGAGDEVFIDVYGASQRQISATVSPEGTIDIEDFGPVEVAGLTVAAATSRLRATLGRRYSGSKIRLTVGQTKTVTVQVMGAVKVPGTYTISAFSTVFNALYQAGGIDDIGTLRNIKVFRGGRQISTVDIYDYILNGRMKGNVNLRDNDIIIVGPYDCLVNISGKVKRPMYYEMKRSESVETLINYAGGFTGDAYQKIVRLVRKNGERYSMFTIDEFERPNFKLMDGDSLSVDSTLQRFENMVMLKGGVNRPGMYEIGKEVRTVRELITKAEGLAPEAYGRHAVLQRKKSDRTLRTISLDLTGIMEGTVADVPLQNEDVIYIMDNKDAQSELTISIYGQVMYPGVYDYAENTSLTDFLVLAGGLTDAASLSKVDVSRRIRNKKSLNNNETLAKTYTFSLTDGLLAGPDSAFKLQPFDEVYVRTSPGYQRQRHVTVSGEVAFEGEYTLTTKAERLSDIIKNCGGLTNEGYARGARLERRMTADEIERQRSLLRVLSSNDSIDVSKLEISNTRSVGINLEKALQNPGNDEWDIVLEEGDRIVVPQYRNTVSVNGEVMYPTTTSFKKGANLDYYINRSGGFTADAKSGRVFVVNMNGTVSKVRSAKDIEPGSEIVVPSKKRRQRMSIGEIMSLGTMTASLASIIAVLL